MTEATTMTNRQAEDIFLEAQAKIPAIEAALQDARANLGKLVLAGKGTQTREALRKLEAELATAHEELSIATYQRDEVFFNNRLAHIQRQRDEADAMEKEAVEHWAIVEEWGPRVEQARQRYSDLANRSIQSRGNADVAEERLRANRAAKLEGR